MSATFLGVADPFKTAEKTEMISVSWEFFSLSPTGPWLWSAARFFRKANVALHIQATNRSLSIRRAAPPQGSHQNRRVVAQL